MTTEMQENKKEKDTNQADYEQLYQAASLRIKELETQLEGLVKRYRKLSTLYNDAIEKILSSE